MRPRSMSGATPATPSRPPPPTAEGERAAGLLRHGNAADLLHARELAGGAQAAVRVLAAQLADHPQTILVSEDDKLLLLSQFVNQDLRLGQASDLTLDDIEVVDVSDIERLGFTGHIYHLENKRVGELLRRILAPTPGH